MQVLFGAWPACADATTEPMQAHGHQGVRPVASLSTSIGITPFLVGIDASLERWRGREGDGGTALRIRGIVR